MLWGLIGGSIIASLLIKGRFNNNLHTYLAENGYKVRRDGLSQYNSDIRGLSIMHLIPGVNLLYSFGHAGNVWKGTRIDKKTKTSDILEQFKEEGLIEPLSADEKLLIDHNKTLGKSNRATVKAWRIREALGMDKLSDRCKAKIAKIRRSKAAAVRAAQAQQANTGAQIANPQQQPQPQQTQQRAPQQRTRPVRRNAQPQQQPAQPTNRPVTPMPQRQPQPAQPTNRPVTPMPQRQPVTPRTPQQTSDEINRINQQMALLQRRKAALEALRRVDQDTEDFLNQYGLGNTPRTMQQPQQSQRRI